MRILKPLQFVMCVALGLGAALQATSQTAPPSDYGGTWVPITYSPPEAAQTSNCGSGYYTCGSPARLLDVVHPYCCLTWQTDPYSPYCEEYDITRVQCAAGGIRYANFVKFNRYFDKNCSNADKTCY